MDLYKIYSTELKKFVMTSREIVIDLIDKGLITGEQAFTLINDIVAAEIKEAIEILNESKKNLGNGWALGQQGTTTVDPWTISTSPWIYNPTSTSATLTSNLDSSTYTLASDISNANSVNSNSSNIANVNTGNANSNVITMLKADDRAYVLKLDNDTFMISNDE